MTIQIPEIFEKQLLMALPEQEVAPLLDSLEWEPNTCVRINTKKHTQIAADLSLSAVAHCPDAFLLKTRPSFVEDPAFHAGYYYVQEANSTIIGEMVKTLRKSMEDSAVVLDLCAAPGGKSTHAASALLPGDLLIANEVIQTRTPILCENLEKWGAGNHIITRADSKRIGESGFAVDLIIADMPCSGEGLFRKDQESINQWSLENVDMCCSRQKRIAADIWPVLNEGGYMIYSTCTFNRHENEENVRWICDTLGAETVVQNFPEDWHFFESEKGMYRLMPHRTAGEGFFFSILRKKGSCKTKNIRTMSLVKSVKHSDSFFTESGQLLEYKNAVVGFDTIDLSLLNSALNHLPSIYSVGNPAGRLFDKGFKPETQLVMLNFYNPKAFAQYNLAEAEVMPYLRRESFANKDQKTGIHCMTWNGLVLGFANGVKSNWNNLWPMNWRVRKEIMLPSSIVNPFQ